MPQPCVLELDALSVWWCPVRALHLLTHLLASPQCFARLAQTIELCSTLSTPLNRSVEFEIRFFPNRSRQGVGEERILIGTALVLQNQTTSKIK